MSTASCFTLVHLLSEVLVAAWFYLCVLKVGSVKPLHSTGSGGRKHYIALQAECLSPRLTFGLHKDLYF